MYWVKVEQGGPEKRMPAKALLLSIRPEFAEMIFGGTKKIELRRLRPKVVRGDWVYVYVASPVKALRGAFLVHKVLEDVPRQLWKKVRKHAGVTRKQFDEYYLGASRGFAIVLETVRALITPIELTILRSRWRCFRPPQSYHYVSTERLSQLGAMSG
jgi:predicted transcriptional regulator